MARWAAELGHRGPLIAGHRGNSAHVLENTLPSFVAASVLPVAVELDVRMSSDGVVVVFHDATLDRLAGRAETVSALLWRELKTIELVHPTDPSRRGYIPRLADVVAALPASVPLLVEIKCEQGPRVAMALTSAIVSELGHRPLDSFAVMSFNPFVVGALRRHYPQVMRGYLYETYEHVRLPVWQKYLLRSRVLGPWMRPHFWGPNVDLVTSRQVARDHARLQATVVWTADTVAERTHAVDARADVLITNDPGTALNLA